MENRSEGYKLRRSTRWIYATLPASIVVGPLSAVITLYILQLGGSVIDVSYAIALASALAIPAAFFWGSVSDMFQKRRAQIVISYLGLAVLLVAFVLLSSVLGVIIVYGLYAFITAANATPLNLLVMETSPRQRWAGSFSKLQTMGSLGATMGFVVAVIVTGLLSLRELMLVFFALAIASSALTVVFVFQPREKISRLNFTRNLFAFMSRIFTTPVMIMRTPKISTMRRLWRKLLSPADGQRKLTLIYAAIFVFSVGSGLFNTVYPAGLKEAGLAESSVFLVLLVGMAVQVAAFYLLGTSFKRSTKISTITSSLALRAVSYIMMGAGFLLYARMGAFIGGLIFYPIASGIAYAFYYTASNTMVFDSLKGPDRGSALGAYTALMGIGTFIGAIASGYSAFYLGYWFTFVIAGALILASGYIFSKVRHAPAIAVTATAA